MYCSPNDVRFVYVLSRTVIHLHAAKTESLPHSASLTHVSFEMTRKHPVLNPTVLLEKIDSPTVLKNLRKTNASSSLLVEDLDACMHQLRARRGLNTTPDSSLSSSNSCDAAVKSPDFSHDESSSATPIRRHSNVYYVDEDESSNSEQPAAALSPVHSVWNAMRITSTQLSSPLYLAVSLGILTFLCIAFILSRYNSQPHKILTSTLIRSLTDQLSAEFPGQSRRFWAQLRVALEPYVQSIYKDHGTTEIQNSVLLLVNRQNSSELNAANDVAFQCLQRRLRKLLESIPLRPSGCHLIEAAELDVAQPNIATIKIQLDEQWHRLYDEGFRCFQFPSLNRFPSAMMTFFHGSTDPQNSQYKNAILLFTLQLPSHFVSTIGTSFTTESRLEQSIRHYLRSLWSPSLGPDEVEALLSRLTRNVAVFQTIPGSTGYPTRSCQGNGRTL